MPVGAGRRGIYSIGAVARMLDIPVATIRNWEERYATVVPERSAGGRRLYSHGQVERLRYVASQVAGGLSAADAHRLLAEHEAHGPVAADDAPADRAGPLVLVAERDAAAAELAQTVLRTGGYAAEPVFTAAEAERRWEQSGARLAIVELMIAGGEGIELCRRLKRHGAGAVLAVSVLEARDEALAAGADAFLRKPVDPLELLSTVTDLLARSAPVGAS